MPFGRGGHVTPDPGGIMALFLDQCFEWLPEILFFNFGPKKAQFVFLNPIRIYKRSERVNYILYFDGREQR